jgi:hypothetical protein
MVFCDRIWKGILKFLKFLQAVRTLLSFHPDGGLSGHFYLLSRHSSCRIFFLAFQRHQFHLNPILEQRVMIKTLRRVQKSSWKLEKRLNVLPFLPDGCYFPIRVWTWNPISTQILNSLTYLLDGVSLTSGRSSALKLLDTAGRPDAFKGPSWRLHKNRLFRLENCMESSWTSS